jgi:hypothetical protein
VPSGAKADELIVRILKEKDPAKRMKALHDSMHPQAQFLWAIFRDSFHYIAVHLDSIADNARDVDSRCAGASAGSKGHSNYGSPQVGSKSRNG